MSEENIVAEGVGPALGGTGAPCPSITFCGKAWKIGWPTQESRLNLELLIAEYAEASTEERKRRKNKKEQTKLDTALENDLRAGQHRSFGALWTAAIDSPDGMSLCLLSLLLEHQPNATLADAKVLWGSAARQVRLALAQVMPSFCTLLVETPLIEEEIRAVKAAEFLELMLARIAPPPPTPTPENPTTSDVPGSA